MEKDPQTTDYATILADMEARRAALDTAIAGLRAAIAAGILGAFGELQTNSATGSGTIPPAGATDLPRGAFLGKTAREAIRLYLSTVRRKQTNKEIAQALQDGGLESTGNFDKYITSALFRLKEDGELLRFDDGWGLSEWYNEAFRAKLGASNTKKPVKRKAKTKTKKPVKKDAAVKTTASPTVAAAPAAQVVQAKSVDDRIIEFLNFSAPHGVISKDVEAALGHSVGVANFSFARLTKMGLVTRGPDGRYHLTKEPE